jgi:hypothetical protein
MTAQAVSLTALHAGRAIATQEILAMRYDL